MVIVLQFILAFLICTVVPVLVGDLMLPQDAIGKQYITGVLGTLAVSQIIYLPVVLFQQHFTPFFIVYVLIIAGLCILSVVKRHKHYRERCRDLLNIKENLGRINFWMICAILLVGFQTIRVAIGHFFVYADNARYIPIINDLIETDLDYYLDFIKGVPGAKETDIKYLFTTYFPYLASISKISGLHPAILVQTLLPIILTVTTYVLVWHYGLLLFKDKQSSWMFVLFFGILAETIGGYDNTHANSLVSAIYFGKKIVFLILLPYILLFIAEKAALLEDNVNQLSIKDILLLVIMVLGICAPSLMGTGLTPIALFALGVVLAIRRRSLKPLGHMGIAMIPSIIFLSMVVIHLYFR
jgi:hypothetical protein